MQTGMISVGEAPESWEFTSEHWREDSYLWNLGDGRILCSFLCTVEPGRGAFRRLVNGIESSWMKVAVPVPPGAMQSILEHYGFEPHMEYSDDMEECVEVWERPIRAVVITSAAEVESAL